jgi:hypothetical protein
MFSAVMEVICNAKKQPETCPLTVWKRRFQLVTDSAHMLTETAKNVMANRLVPRLLSKELESRPDRYRFCLLEEYGRPYGFLRHPLTVIQFGAGHATQWLCGDRVPNC